MQTLFPRNCEMLGIKKRPITGRFLFESSVQTMTADDNANGMFEKQTAWPVARLMEVPSSRLARVCITLEVAPTK